jgi:outer membrane protein
MMRAAPFTILLTAICAPAMAQQTQQPRVVTLEEALRTARERQPQIRQAMTAVQAARARADQARSALLPQVSGVASFDRSQQQFTQRGAGGQAVSTSVTQSQWRFGASANQLVFDFGRTPNQWRAAKSAAEAQQFIELTTEQQILLNAETAFFNARAQKALIGVAQETVSNQQRHLDQIQGFVDVGTRPEIDLAQARTLLANAQVQLVNAENGYETTKAQLNQAMGVEGSTDYDVADNSLSPITGEEQSTDALLDEALRARPEFGTVSNQIRSQELTLASVRGSYWPALGLSGNLSDVGIKPVAQPWNWGVNWNALATLDWPIFQGGLTRAQAREAIANLEGLKAQADTLRLQVRLEVDEARLAVRAAKATLVASEEAVVSAREQLRLAEGRYQTGVGNSIELSDAQLSFTNAEAQRVQADYSLSSARAQLLKALGRL